LAHLQESLLGLLEALNNCLFRITREAILFDHKVVQLVPQELSALLATMPVVYAKEAAFWPVFIFSVVWLCDIKDDGDPILIIVPDQTLICDGRISPNNAIALDGTLRWLLVWDDNAGTWLQRQLLAFQLLIR